MYLLRINNGPNAGIFTSMKPKTAGEVLLWLENPDYGRDYYDIFELVPRKVVKKWEIV